MATKKKPTAAAGPIQVEAIVHGDKRSNIPTADAAVFVGPDVEAPSKLRWERDPSLDPQLVWKGKDANADELLIDAPPLYIQEKIDPRVLIENLRQTSAKPEDEPELTLFDTFDGLGELDLVDFYQHDANWSNRMILGDSLQVMGSLAEREGLRSKVQMIYLDPPYGIKFGSNWQPSVRNRNVKDGTIEDAIDVEQIKAFRDTWELGIHSYLTYLRDRLVAARDLLTESGSIFVQIGDDNVHRVRALLDEVFGDENFVSQITYAKTTGAGSGAGGTDVVASVADFLLWYCRSKPHVRFRQPYIQKVAGQTGATKYDQIELPNGERRVSTDVERSAAGLVPGARLFTLDNLTSQSGVDKTRFDVEIDGRVFRPHPAVWKTGESGMGKLLAARRVQPVRSTVRYVRYLDDFLAFPINNVWTDLGGVQSRSDPKVYVVQTATSAIERCMLMCTDPGDLVLDPTCGSGTTATVAEQWGRRWITIDTSRVALALARQRLMASKYPYYLLADTPEGRKKEQDLSGVALPGVPTNDIRKGFVYERVKHITLKSIANNPDIREGMSRSEIDAAIERHAEYEMLYDKPYEDRKKVRVAGPFTVESLSPHRSIAFAGQAPVDAVAATVTDVGEAVSFEQTILDNLAKAGIQNGRKNERFTFESVEPYAGRHIQAIAVRSDAPEGAPKRVAVCVGPQYGTVGGGFIKEATKEAIADPEVDLLAVLAFAFDPQAVGTAEGLNVSDDGFANVDAERKFGRMPVLLVRMNNDLLMGKDLKKTASGNLFTVFGEPDIDVRRAQNPDGDGGMFEVEIIGVDVYDPTTGEIRSRDIDHIALWMIDTNYNDESFFVRHCYFTGGNDPYKRLKVALKADIDEEAWASLYRTVSRPFAIPETGKIAIKVINDYGDEVVKVVAVAP
jgi:adenine-specific DNA-methyltransferase